jgi:transcriptional regulator with XRE-family HTH domain
MGDKDTRRVGRPRARETALSKWIDASGKTRDEIAERLGVKRQWLDKLCRAERRPSLDLALEIEKMTKGQVPASFWKSVPPHSA